MSHSSVSMVMMVALLVFTSVSASSSSVSSVSSTPWSSLAASLKGDLVLPSAPAYHNDTIQWNTRFVRTPAALAYCVSAADVSTSLLFARKFDVTFSLRSGGHNTEGWAVCDGCLVIDVSNMKDMDVDKTNGVVTAGMGMMLVEYDNATVAHSGLLSPTGLCPSVGLAGYATGGGIGWTTRSQGLFIDTIVRYEVVLANGSMVTVGAHPDVPNSALRGMLPINGDPNPSILHEDLFWALRGGGGGNLAIVTSATMVLDPAPTAVLYAEYEFDLDQAHKVTDLFFASDHEYFEFFLLFVAPEPGKVLVLMQGIWSGNATEGYTALQPFTDLAHAGSGSADLRVLSYVEAKAAFSSGGISVPIAGKQKSAFVPPSLVGNMTVAGGGIDTIIDHLKVIPPAAGRHSAVYLNHMGNVVNQPAPGDTAFPHRTYAANWVIDAHWEDAANVTDASIEWTRELYRAMAPYVAPATYYNYLDRDLCDPALNPLNAPWEEVYWGQNVARLMEVKGKYDPDGIFTTWPQALNGTCDVTL